MAAPVRIVELDEENAERALVPVTPYASESIVSSWEESSEPWKTSSMQTSSMPFTYQEGQYNMDHNTLMFIAAKEDSNRVECLEGLHNHQHHLDLAITVVETISLGNARTRGNQDNNNRALLLQFRL